MAILKITVIDTNTRYAKEIRFLGIPIYLMRILDLKTKGEEKTRQIGFTQIGDTSLLEVGNEED